MTRAAAWLRRSGLWKKLSQMAFRSDPYSSPGYLRHVKNDEQPSHLHPLSFHHEQVMSADDRICVLPPTGKEQTHWSPCSWRPCTCRAPQTQGRKGSLWGRGGTHSWGTPLSGPQETATQPSLLSHPEQENNHYLPFIWVSAPGSKMRSSNIPWSKNTQICQNTTKEIPPKTYCSKIKTTTKATNTCKGKVTAMLAKMEEMNLSAIENDSFWFFSIYSELTIKRKIQFVTQHLQSVGQKKKPKPLHK